MFVSFAENPRDHSHMRDPQMTSDLTVNTCQQRISSMDQIGIGAGAFKRISIDQLNDILGALEEGLKDRSWLAGFFSVLVFRRVVS